MYTLISPEELRDNYSSMGSAFQNLEQNIFPIIYDHRNDEKGPDYLNIACDVATNEHGYSQEDFISRWNKYKEKRNTDKAAAGMVIHQADPAAARPSILPKNTDTSKTDSSLPIARKAKNDISTFVEAISKHFPIRYNELNQRGEIFINGHWRDISPSDGAIITQYCQDVYGISHRANMQDAILICQQTNIVNPLMDILTSLKWDGKPRTTLFLHDVMKCDDTPITREISQMIFTGGIRRAFEPGCKWDNVPILVGKQGSGKSTAVDLLGLGYSGLIKTFSGKEAIENIGGLWICEIGELSAVRKSKDIEEIKSFITTQSDKYRKPYAHYDEIIKRRCIFIGTTNSNAFLSDQTGNRRFFPVTVHSDGKAIWKHIDDIKEYIRQAWAEAVAQYHDGTLPTDYDHSIDSELNNTRNDYQSDDWKIGAIDSYLDSMTTGEKVCCLQLWIEACNLDQDKLTMGESRIIGEHLDNHPEWERMPGNKKPRFTISGRTTQQRAWIKKAPFPFP